MKALSLRQATNCEEAREHVCRCRCNGALHGVARGKGETFFNALPADDPHHIPSKEAKKEARRREREESRRRRYEACLNLLCIGNE